MEIKKERNRVNIFIDGKLAGFATFMDIEDSVVIINHTMVYPPYRGKGIASLLMETVVEILKESNKKCRPSCSYAASWFEKHQEFNELLDL